jgi:hypothetical protein
MYEKKKALKKRKSQAGLGIIDERNKKRIIRKNEY